MAVTTNTEEEEEETTDTDINESGEDVEDTLSTIEEAIEDVSDTDYEDTAEEIISELPEEVDIEEMTREEAEEAAELDVDTTERDETTEAISDLLESSEVTDWESLYSTIQSYLGEETDYTPLTYEEAYEQAEASLSEEYEDALEETMANQDVIDIERGFYGQAPADAIKAATAAELESEAIAEYATLAQQLVEASEATSLAQQEIDLDSAELTISTLLETIDQESEDEQAQIDNYLSLAELLNENISTDADIQEWQLEYAQEIYTDAIELALQQNEATASSMLEAIALAMDYTTEQQELIVDSLLELAQTQETVSQNDIENILAEADLMGELEGEQTEEAREFDASMSLAESELSLAEYEAEIDAAYKDGQLTLAEAELALETAQQEWEQQFAEDEFEWDQYVFNTEVSLEEAELAVEEAYKQGLISVDNAELALANKEYELKVAESMTEEEEENQEEANNAALSEASTQQSNGTLEDWWNENKAALASSVSTSVFTQIMEMVYETEEEEKEEKSF